MKSKQLKELEQMAREKKNFKGKTINEKEIYECSECGLKFRLKYNLIFHKCRGFKIDS